MVDAVGEVKWWPMKIRVDESVILDIYRFCREAERSVDALLTGDWHDFQHYWRSGKAAEFQVLLGRLEQFLPPGLKGDSRPERHVVARGLSWRRLLPLGLAKVLARLKGSWQFPGRELQFVTFALKSLLSLGARPAKPGTEEITGLRQDLYVSELIVRARCN